MRMSWLQAANMALIEEMARDSDVFVMGEDVRAATFGLTTGVLERFGTDRVRDTPIAEETFVGAAVGAAMLGMRPVVDLGVATFSYTAFDQIVNQMAKNRFLFGGQASVPVVIILHEYHRSNAAAQHTDRPHGTFMSIPGLTVLAPGSPRDAKGLIKSAIRSDDPVLIFSDMTTWNRKGEVPEDQDFLLPIGPAHVVKSGSDVTLVSVLSRNPVLAAAELLEREGISVEIIELVSLSPLDEEAIVQSVRKTGRLVVADIAYRTAGAAAEVAAIAAERCFDALLAPVERVCPPDIHVPFTPSLERAMFPDAARIFGAAKRALQPFPLAGSRLGRE